ncbi:MAG: glycoside hydrolase family 2 protein [Bacteroidales bacterium]
MKNILALTALSLGSLCASDGAMAANTVRPIALSDTATWYFKEATQTEWLPAVVPGTVHDDLLRLNLIPDPFFGTNEDSVQWVEDKDWEYKTTFTITPDQLAHDEAILNFEGLDTFADIYLNGALLKRTQNMFVGYEIPVKAYLQPGVNRLNLLFHSPMKQAMGQFLSAGFTYPADNDHRKERVSIFTRKAPYSYGWDWGIRLATSGIWRPVTLSFHDQVKIDNLYIRQQSLTDKEARLNVRFELQNLTDKPTAATLRLTGTLDGKQQVQKEQTIRLEPGCSVDSLQLSINDPQRWMPRGWGKANLYDIALTVEVDGKEVAQKQHRFGLRTVRLVHEPDSAGRSFYFEVNGKRLFAKGSNYIPDDALLNRVDSARYRRMFRDMTEANMNMIRIWGGGIYENDYFYDLADENGILVWQDFMFGCTAYPHDPAFLENVKEEARYNIRRLRNHASLALWCGNNEVEEGIKYWGWQKKYGKEIHDSFVKGYDILFREVLKDQVAQYDDRQYVHGSPFSANWGRIPSLASGDSHYWGVWYGQQPFEILDTNVPRFMSEFGFQSFPEMKTIATFAGPEDLEIESTVMNKHQKSSIGNHLIKTYMERDYIVPAKFEDFVYVGLVLQGQGMRHGFEAHRRNRPYCEGTLYWQFNDSWPVVSWAGVDYWGNWKALHYQAQRAFEPILINAIEEKGQFNVYLLSDSLAPVENARLSWQQIDFAGKLIQKGSLKTSVPANGNVLAMSVASGDFAQKRNSSFVLFTLKDAKGKEIGRTVYFFEKPKDLALPQVTVRKQMKQRDGSIELTLSADRLAKDLFIEIPIQGARFTDNFFDLLPGEKRKVIITSPEIRKNGDYPVTVRHLRETY